MHNALRLPEILDNIFDKLPDASLAVLCHTCRSFFVPAASILWKTVDREDRIEALASILFESSDESSIQYGPRPWDQDEQSPEHQDSRYPLGSRETRFAVYSQFVRQLAVSDHPCEEEWHDEEGSVIVPSWSNITGLAYGSVHDMAMLHGSALPIFPALRSLSWTSSSPSKVYMCIEFLCGSLNEVYFRCTQGTSFMESEWTTAVIDFVVALVDRSPHLLTLSVFIQPGRRSAYAPILYGALRRFRDLTAFKCNLMPEPQLLLSLADLPWLKVLSFLTPSDPVSGRKLKSTIVDPVPTLSELKVLQAELPIEATLALILPHSGQLRTLHTRHVSKQPLPSVKVARLVSQICLCTNLTSLGLCLLEPFEDENFEVDGLSWDTFSPILRYCPQIMMFNLEISRSTFRVYDPDVESLATAWPRLQTVRIKRSPSTRPLTLRTLRSLAVHCPDLSSVHIEPLAALGIPSLTSGASAVSTPMSLTFMGGICLPPPNEVAAFLRALWPSVAQAKAITSSRHWEQVEAMLNIDGVARETRSSASLSTQEYEDRQRILVQMMGRVARAD